MDRASRASRISRPESTYSQVPVQNFPDYLRYVMMKSMAGFGKVHNELTRLYYGNSEKASRGSQQIEPTENTLKEKKKSRQRFSMKESLLSSGETSKPQNITSSQTFTSYILEEDEEETRSNRESSESHLYSSLSDLSKLTDNDDPKTSFEPHSAPPFNRHSDMFKFDHSREKMPYSDLITDDIYVNDRVVRVEQPDIDTSDVSKNLPLIDSKPKQESLCDVPGDYVDMNNKRLPLSKQPKLPVYNIGNNDGSYGSKTANDEPEEQSDYDHPDSWTHDYVNAPPKRNQIESTYNSSEKSLYRDTNTTTKNALVNRNGMEAIKGNYPQAKDMTAKTREAVVSQEEPDYDVPVPGIRPVETLTNYDNKPDFVVDNHYAMGRSLNGEVPKQENDYDVLAPGTRPVNALVNTPGSHGIMVDNNDRNNDSNTINKVGENDYDVPVPGNRSVKPTAVNATTGHNIATEISKSTNTCEKSDNDYDVPKSYWKICKDNRAVFKEIASPPKLTTPTSEINVNNASKNSETHVPQLKVKNCAAPTKSVQSDIKPFTEFNVDEVVDCLNNCSLAHLAKVCQEQGIDGAHLCRMTEAELIKEPFVMNWFYISKLFKIIKGWRPKRNSAVQLVN